MSTFNDKHLLWWVFKLWNARTSGDFTLDLIQKGNFDDLVDSSDIPEKEKYKTWIWNAFDCKRRIYLDATSPKK